MSEPSLRHTPLYDVHQALGARIVPFAGFAMPIQYSGIIEEHLAVRRAAGLFDVSHMGEVEISGPNALACVQHLITNDADRLFDGRVLYTAMCYEDGGVVDDLLVYRLAEDRYLLVINASNIEKDVAWMRANNPMGATITDISDRVALIALQGPNALDILTDVTSAPVDRLDYYHFLTPEPEAFLGCEHAILSHTGYTGEKGFELYCEPERAVAVWEALMEAGRDRGLLPAGLGARDTLRLEAGYCLYGHELTEETNPLEAGLVWITRLNAEPFIGRDALLQVQKEGLKRKLVAFVMDERGIPRPGYPILNDDNEPIGEVTSGTQSPVLNQGIGMGYVLNEAQYVTPGARLSIGVRNRILQATVRKPPLHRV